MTARYPIRYGRQDQAKVANLLENFSGNILILYKLYSTRSPKKCLKLIVLGPINLTIFSCEIIVLACNANQ